MQRTHMESKVVSATYGATSGADKTHLCSQYVNLIQVDDVKVNIKEEPHEANAQDDETRVHTTLNETLNLMSNVKEELGDFQSAQTSTYQRVQPIGFKVNQSECYYIRSLLVQCPACDTSYRGGRHQLPRLYEHVRKCHKRNCFRFIKSIKARYRVKKMCDCFACIVQRGKKSHQGQNMKAIDTAQGDGEAQGYSSATDPIALPHCFGPRSLRVQAS